MDDFDGIANQDDLISDDLFLRGQCTIPSKLAEVTFNLDGTLFQVLKLAEVTSVLDGTLRQIWTDNNDSVFGHHGAEHQMKHLPPLPGVEDKLIPWHLSLSSHSVIVVFSLTELWRNDHPGGLSASNPAIWKCGLSSYADI